MKKLISSLCLVLGMVAPALSQYVADYDPVRNTLTLPWVQVGSDYYSNVVLSVPPGQPWSLSRSGTRLTTTPGSNGAVYDASTALLSIPAVSVQAAASARVAARSAVRSANVEAPTLVGGVDISLAADGNWNVVRTGSSVRITSTRDIDPISGTILDRFSIECSITTGTETCENEGLRAGQAFGLDTDADGDLDQVWKVGESSQCLTIQTGIFDTVPHAASDWLGDDAAEAGTLNAEIYAHPDGLYIMRYGIDPDWLSCTVVPVSGMSSIVLNNTANAGNISVSSTSLTGEVGDVLSFYILGGTPPYTVISENTSLASVAFGSSTSNLGQLVTVTLNSTGLSNSDTASTQLFIFDWFQKNTAIPVTINKVDEATAAGGALSFYPTISTDNPLSEGTTVQVRVLGGTPPFTIFNPLPDYVQVTAVEGLSDTFNVYLAGLPPGSESLQTVVLFTDAAGLSGSYTVPISQNPTLAEDMSLSTAGAVYLYPGSGATVAVSGGYPPFTFINPNTDWFEVGQVSERVFIVRMSDDAIIPMTGFCATNSAITTFYMPVMDSQGHMVTMAINPQLQCGLAGSYK